MLPICKFLILIFRGLKKLFASITVLKRAGPFIISDPEINLIDYRLGWTVPTFFYYLPSVFFLLVIINLLTEVLLKIYSRASVIVRLLSVLLKSETYFF